MSDQHQFGRVVIVNPSKTIYRANAKCTMKASGKVYYSTPASAAKAPSINVKWRTVKFLRQAFGAATVRKNGGGDA